MTADLAVLGVALLLPLLAVLTLRQRHLLHAIIGRGMLGILAALVYALMGAPDVAVTEALMGVLLVTLLYVIVFTSSGEFRVGYVELPPLVSEGKRALTGYEVELLRAFGDSCGVRPRFVAFTERGLLLDALRSGVVEAAVGPFVSPFDEGEDVAAFPVVETKVMVMQDGRWFDILSARREKAGLEKGAEPGTVQTGSYVLLVSRNARDLRETFARFLEGGGRETVVELRQRYLGGRRA
ncbi:MAG: DUF4040 domain-containing protein [Synergistales bacterium]|nr:DUF4040 domain-containing protein [Synergistales bacterium]